MEQQPDNTASQELESAPVDGETPDKPKERSPLAQFCAQLHTIFNEKERYSSFRATPNGLFIAEEMVQRTAAEYRLWLEKEKFPVSKKSELHTLFSTDTPAAQYLLDGKACLAGYLAESDLSAERKLPLPYFQGSLLSAQSYLHMRDPMLTRLEKIEAKIDSSGFRLVIHSRKQPAIIRSDIFTQIATAMQRSRSVVKRFPSVESAFRNCLPALVTLWAEAKVIGRDKPLLVPSGYLKSKDVWFIQMADLVVIQDGAGNIVHCYGLRGKNFHEFLVGETENLKRSGGKVGSFQLSRSPRQRGVLGTLRLERDSFGVTPAAFRYFVERLGKLRETPIKLKPRYTLRDCIAQFAEMVSQTGWVNSLDIPAELRRSDRKWNYRKKKNWVLILEGTDTIETVVDLEDWKAGESRAPRPQSAPPKERRRRGQRRRKQPNQSKPRSPQAASKDSGKTPSSESS